MRAIITVKRPIFTAANEESVAVFIKHGADLTIRNKKGQTVLEADRENGGIMQQALREGIDKRNRR